MKTRTLKVSLLSVAMLMATTAAQADHNDDNMLIRARVVSSTPIYESVNDPRRECWTETSNSDSRDYADRSYRNNMPGSIIGALAGGLLGSTVGKGNGRVAAAAVAAATGAVVGGQWNNGNRYERYPQQVERCRTNNHYRQVMNGYDVRYRLQGRDFQTRLPYDPGRWVMLNANMTVAQDQSGERLYNTPARSEWESRTAWDDRGQRRDDDHHQWDHHRDD